jgi:high-affinity Fe2+/Pb2+ permease
MIKPRHRIKRNVALASFLAILGSIPVLFLAVVFGDENTANNLSAAAPIFATALVTLGGLVMGYFGVVHHDDLRNGDA